MEQGVLISALAWLTAFLEPTPASSPEALDRARRAVAQALLNSQQEAIDDEPAWNSAAIPETIPDSVLATLEQIARDVLAAPADPSARLSRRFSPVASSRVPAWATGWQPAAGFGPFRDRDGRTVWFDIRHTGQFITMAEAASGQLIAALPAMPLAAGASRIELRAGSVWLLARMFDVGAPSGAFAGVRIRGGLLELSHAGEVHGTTLLINSAITATLRLDLLPPNRPARSRFGGDATDVVADLPANVVLRFRGASGGELVNAGDARLEVYGNAAGLKLRPGPGAHYDSSSRSLQFQAGASLEQIRIDHSRSAVFQPSGGARLSRAWWTVPVALPQGGSPVNLGDAAGAGALALRIDGVVPVQLPALGSAGPVVMNAAYIAAAPGSLSVTGTAAGVYRQTLRLWNFDEQRRSRLELLAAKSVSLSLDAAAGAAGGEALAADGLECAAQLDRPLTAANQRVPFFSKAARMDVSSSAAGLRVGIQAPASPPLDPVGGLPLNQPGLSFALENAFAATGPALELRAFGSLSGGGDVDEGSASLRFGVSFLLPMLPDPYAANVSLSHLRPAERQNAAPAGTLLASVRWTAPATPAVAFELVSVTPFPFPPVFLPIQETPIESRQFGLLARERTPWPEVEATFAGGQDLFRLLDLSSNADLFGVGFSLDPNRRALAAQAVRLDGMDLVSPARDVSVFTLPAFQWEPVYDMSAQPGFPPRLDSVTDGGPTRFALNSARLVPIAPLPAIDLMLDQYRNAAPLSVRFTLPFGMVAVANMTRVLGADPGVVFPPGFSNVRPLFPDWNVQGGVQLRLESQGEAAGGAGGPVALMIARSLPGSTVQTDNGASGLSVLSGPVNNVLVNSIETIFNDSFAAGKAIPQVPVLQVDFSGYGGSTFSDWRNPDPAGAGVSLVRLEALSGRTSREVVQAHSKIVPYGVRAVRTITMHRGGSGGVFRRDSGWQPVSDGEYQIAPDVVVHPGVLPRIVNVRNIRETSTVYQRVYPAAAGQPSVTVELVQVLLDGDVEVEDVTLGANSDNNVPVHDLVGYLQLQPIGQDLDARQIDDLLASTGPLGGPIDCELNVGSSGLLMRLSRMEVDRTATAGNSPQLAAVARGTVGLPATGQWTFAFRGSSDPAPRALDGGRGIPLIRANPAGPAVPPYRFAEPAELYHPVNPGSEYGLLHATGGQRLYAPQPFVRRNEPIIRSGATLLFADTYALAGIVTLFPRPDLCHVLPAGSLLRITGTRKLRLEIPPQPGLAAGEFPVTILERTLSSASSLVVRSRFRSGATIRLSIDSDLGPDWSCSFGPVGVIGDVDGLPELIQVAGMMGSSAVAPQKLENPQVTFGGVLAPLQALIDFLTAFGLPVPLSVAITNAKFSVKTSALYDFPKILGKEEAEAINQGLGFMLEVELELGLGNFDDNVVDAGFGALGATPGNGGWMMFLKISTKIMGKVLDPLPVFLGGASKFEIESSSNGASKVSYGFGLAGVVDIDAKVISLTGSRTYLTVLQREFDPSGAPKVGVGVSSEWEVESEMAEGLAGVKLSFELLILVEKTDDYHARGQGTLAIDLTAAYVLHKSFEVEFDVDERIAAAAFVAATVLPLA